MSLVASYRKHCKDTCGLSVNTIRQRLSYICAFYNFALKQDWVKRLPYNLEERSTRRGTSLLEHINASGGKARVDDAMPRNHKSLPKYLRISEIKSLLSAADNHHHRMMIQLALHTGLRRNELSTFPLLYVFDPDEAGRTERNFRIRLDPTDGSGMQTKGSKAREIFVSRKTMTALHHLFQRSAEKGKIQTKIVKHFLLTRWASLMATTEKASIGLL